MVTGGIPDAIFTAKPLFTRLAHVSEVVRRSKRLPFQVLAETCKPDSSARTRGAVRRMVNFTQIG